MRKFLLLLVLGLFCTIAQAVPADNAPGKVRQPDGTTLTVCLHGDEFFNYLTTIDGYTVVQPTMPISQGCPRAWSAMPWFSAVPGCLTIETTCCVVLELVAIWTTASSAA